MEKHFYGSFIKDKNYFQKDEISRELVEFLPEKYAEAQREIIEILGDKEKYNGYEAARFFQKKYGCMQIPLVYQQFYRDGTGCFFGFFRPFELNALYPYEYGFNYAEGPRENGEEEVICLLVDYYRNLSLSDKYPCVREKRQKAIDYKARMRQEWQNRNTSALSDDYYPLNDIIIIGSKDDCNINSMAVPEGPALIEDIEYEIRYFYNHS